MSYQDDLVAHLSAYRQQVLKIEKRGVFHYRGRSIPKTHILPIEYQELNILPGVRLQVLAYVEAPPKIRLHRYFHHLNSSQAFTLNLFVPYFEGGPTASAALFRALGVEGRFDSWAAEHIPDPDEETNIDVLWRARGIKDSDELLSYICEVKLSEADFGTAAQDEKHLAKIAATYTPVLTDHVDPALLQPESFCKHYQILRMAWHAVRVPNSRLMFLLPRANARLWKVLSNVTARFAEPLHHRLRIVAVEDVLEALRRDEAVPAQLRDHAVALCQKYLPDSARRR